MNQMQIVKIVALMMAGRPISEDDIANLLLTVRGQACKLTDKDEIEQGLVDLASAALIEGATVIELTAQPKMFDGKKVRLVAVLG